MNWLRRFMYGRYGTDQLSMFLFVCYILLFLLEMFLKNTVAAPILMTLSYLIIFLYFFRCLSRNIYRRQAENQRFLRMIHPFKNYIKYLKLKFRERNGVKKLYRCPKCHQIIRVPKGRGKIAITCPKCRFEFIKRT